MRGRCGRVVALSGAFSLVVAGCTAADDGAADGRPAASDDAGAVEEADEQPAAPSGRLLLSGFRDDNPSGVSVEVTSVEVDEGGHLLLGIDVVNTAVGGRVDIGQYRNVLVDDVGNYYDFQRVPDNE